MDTEKSKVHESYLWDENEVKNGAAGDQNYYSPNQIVGSNPWALENDGSNDDNSLQDNPHGKSYVFALAKLCRNPPGTKSLYIRRYDRKAIDHQKSKVIVAIIITRALAGRRRLVRPDKRQTKRIVTVRGENTRRRL